MAHNTTATDLNEEDAADLQFPKEKIQSSSIIQNLTNKCANCLNELSDTFILCVVCDVNICTYCFTNGAEFQSHHNDHNYKVLNNDFPLFENSDWTAKEETELLDGLLIYNNWNAIAKFLPNRTPKEIKEHYEYFYLDNNTIFQDIQLNEVNYYDPIIPYRFRLNNIQEPFRNNENAPAGYNCARSDFEYEYDKNGEEIVSHLKTLDLTDPNYNILSDLQMGIVNAYRRKILERYRRKKIIREHGLIMPQKTVSWLHRYNSTITPLVYEKLVRFMQFFSGEGFEHLMEGLHRAGELKLQIARLCEYRKRGIRTLDEANLYVKLKNHREDSLKQLKHFHHISELSVKYKNVPIPISMTGSKRRSMTPLEVLGMPGYEKLSLNERELCRTIRLPPINYMELKSILIGENNKLGFLRLLTARRLLKIDVNKTRKLYDFLISEGYIHKPND